MGYRRAAAGPGSRRPADVGFAIASCAVLAAYNNVAGMQSWHRRCYPVVNAGATAAALSAAAASGLTATDLGLGRAGLLPGLRLGSRLAAAAAGGWLAIAVVPAARRVLRDRRIAGLTGCEVAYQVMVRIPVGTVLWEETAFRGVLQAALRRVMPGGTAVAVASGVFGIWHIRPTIGALRANKLAAGPGRTLAAVTAGVAATAAGGALLSWLRTRSGSLAAPVLLHLATNCAGPLAAYAIAHLAANGGQTPSSPRPDPAGPRGQTPVSTGAQTPPARG
jgi:membrane protease YdiL (CAAX protease family)